MSVVRFLALLLLVAWVGGLVALGGVAAPQIFAVLERQDPAAGRTIAGAVFGGVLEQFLRLSLIAGGLFGAVLAARAAVGRRPRRLWMQVVLLAGMLAPTATTAWWLAPRIDVLRAEVGQSMASLPETDPRRQEFNRLHGLSNGLMLVTLAAGVALLWTDVGDTRR